MEQFLANSAQIRAHSSLSARRRMDTATNDRANTTPRLDPGFDQAFDELLVTWGNHQQLRTSHANVSTLWSSRTSLDEARREVAQRRHATCS